MVKPKKEPVRLFSEQHTSPRDLLLYNDDVNTFDYVIEMLIEVCDHQSYQAEQCAYIAHYKGKCEVKSGFYAEIKPKYDEMTRRGLTVAID